jgi:phosphohistidine phosphatase
LRRLTLLRHAHAGDAPPGGQDFDRPLSARGCDQARALGLRLGATLPSPQRLRVSGALRTRMTSDLVCRAAWPSVPAEVASTLYLATLDALLKEIASTPETCSHLAIVGHNPGLSELWSRIGGEPGFGELAPCEWRSREFDVTNWQALGR